MGTDASFLAPSLHAAHHQVAAIPVRWAAGESQILLITTRGKGVWMAPKGWPLTEAANPHCAAREAFEEAGVKGFIEPHPLGDFQYEKRIGKSRLPFRATAFLLRVERVHADWPERRQRKRTWFPLAVAKSLVNNRDLADLMDEAARRLRTFNSKADIGGARV